MEKVYTVQSYEEAQDYEDEGMAIFLGVFSSFEKAAESGKASFDSLGEFTVSEYELDSQICSEVVKFCKDESEGWYSY